MTLPTSATATQPATPASTPAAAPQAVPSNGTTTAGPTMPGTTAPKSFQPPGSSRLPSGHRANGRTKYIILGLAALILGVAAFVTFKLRLHREPFNGPTWTVKREKLVFSVVERGSLESAENNDIVCTLKARSPQSTLASTIRSIYVEDGQRVKKGQVLMQLDDSGLIENLKTQRITVDNAKADWITAEEDYKIVISQNDSDIKNALAAVVLTKLDLQKYIGRVWSDEMPAIVGAVASLSNRRVESPLTILPPLLVASSNDSEYQQSLQDVMGRLELAQSDRDQWLDRAGWSRRMTKLGYLSKTQADADQSKLESAEYALKKVQTERQILNITKTRTLIDLQNKLDEAYRGLARVQTQANAKDQQADAKRRTKKSVLDQEVERKVDLETEIEKCKITAPKSGMVVYYVSEQTRGGFGGRNSIIAQGESVIEGQKLLRIPDLSKMTVNVRVHEAMVSHIQKNQKAKVQIDAFPGTFFDGHVLSVATVPSQVDMFASDIKVYQTIVTIDENLSGLPLKPQMSARATITADESPSYVLTIPIQSVVGTLEMGKTRKCFVIGADGDPVDRAIVVGMNNDKVVEVVDGLHEGEVVVLNPGPLLIGDNSKLKPGVPKVPVDAKAPGGDGRKWKGKNGAPGNIPPGAPGSIDKGPPDPSRKGGAVPPPKAIVPMGS